MNVAFILVRYEYDGYQSTDEIAVSLSKEKLIEHFQSMDMSGVSLVDITTKEGFEEHMRLQTGETHYGIYSLELIK